MKYQLELNIASPDTIFLSYWDAETGNDVVCEVIDGQLIVCNDGSHITLKQFIDLVKKNKTN